MFLRKWDRTEFSSLEILQEPEVREDQLKKWSLRYLKTFWRLILICIFDGWRQNITFFNGWPLNFRPFAGWRLTPMRPSCMVAIHQIVRKKTRFWTVTTTDLSKHKKISEKIIITITRKKTVNKNRNECSYLKKAFGRNFPTNPLCKSSSKLEDSVQAIMVASGYK